MKIEINLKPKFDETFEPPRRVELVKEIAIAMIKDVDPVLMENAIKDNGGSAMVGFAVRDPQGRMIGIVKFYQD